MSQPIPFDPDAYLQSRGGFDPDAYLAKKAPAEEQPQPGLQLLTPELKAELEKFPRRVPDEELARQYREAGTPQQPGLELATPAEAAGSVVRGAGALALDAGKAVVSPIIAGAEKYAEGERTFRTAKTPEDVLRGGADRLLGALEAGIAAIPGMAAVNAAMIASPEITRTGGKIVSNITGALSAADENIARNVGERTGEQATELGTQLGIGAIFGRPVLIGMGLSEATRRVSDAVMADSDLSPQDKERITGIASNLAFFTGAIGSSVVPKMFGRPVLKPEEIKKSAEVVKSASPEDLKYIQKIVDRFEEVRPSGEPGPTPVLETKAKPTFEQQLSPQERYALELMQPQERIDFLSAQAKERAIEPGIIQSKPQEQKGIITPPEKPAPEAGMIQAEPPKPKGPIIQPEGVTTPTKKAEVVGPTPQTSADFTERSLQSLAQKKAEKKLSKSGGAPSAVETVPSGELPPLPKSPQVQVKKDSPGTYRLYYRGTKNPVEQFKGQTFTSPNEARSFYNDVLTGKKPVPKAPDITDLAQRAAESKAQSLGKTRKQDVEQAALDYQRNLEAFGEESEATKKSETRYRTLLDKYETDSGKKLAPETPSEWDQTLADVAAKQAETKKATETAEIVPTDQIHSTEAAESNGKKFTLEQARKTFEDFKIANKDAITSKSLKKAVHAQYLREQVDGYLHQFDKTRGRDVALRPKEIEAKLKAMEAAAAPQWELGKSRDFTFDPNSPRLKNPNGEGRFRLADPNDMKPGSGQWIQTGVPGIKELKAVSKSTGKKFVQSIRFDKTVTEAQAKDFFEKNRDRYRFSDEGQGKAPKKPLTTKETITEKPEPSPAPVVEAQNPLTPSPKEPWEMTKEEWTNSLKDTEEPIEGSQATRKYLQAQNGERIALSGNETQQALNARLARIHKGELEQALSEGKPVPESVLKDYPDLKEKSAKKESPRTETPPVQQKRTEGESEQVKGVPGRPDKFRQMADQMQAQIDNLRREMTQNPTPKRMAQYRERTIEASDVERGQQALRALADAHEKGTVPAILRDLKSKAEILPLVRKGTTSGGGYYDRIPSFEYKDTSPQGKALQRLLEAKPETVAAEGAKQKAQKLAQMEAEVQFRKLPGFFPTPKALIEKMLDAADIKPGDAVLEPSAGKGDILDAIKEKHPETADLVAVENMSPLRDILEAKGYGVGGDDFLEYQRRADKIVMNPPFEKGQDIDHVRHAYDLLNPGGRLVAIMSEGSFSRSFKKETEFREWLDDVGGTSEKSPEGAFSEKGTFRQTGVSSRMVVIDKPQSEARTGTGGKLFLQGLATGSYLSIDAIPGMSDEDKERLKGILGPITIAAIAGPALLKLGPKALGALKEIQSSVLSKALTGREAVKEVSTQVKDYLATEGKNLSGEERLAIEKIADPKELAKALEEPKQPKAPEVVQSITKPPKPTEILSGKALKDRNDAMVDQIVARANEKAAQRAQGKLIVGKELRAKTVLASLKEKLPQYRIDALREGLSGMDVIERVREKLIDELSSDQRYTTISDARKAKAYARLQTESVSAWLRQMETQQKRREVAQRVSERRFEIAGSLADKIFSDKLTKEETADILRTAQRFRTTSDNQRHLTAIFKSRVSVMADSYGAAGAELANRMYQGDINRTHFTESGYNHISKINDIYDKIDNSFEQERISDRVVSALQDRANPEKHLTDPTSKEVYGIAKELLDQFKAELRARRYAVKEDYLPHIEDVDVVEQALNDILDPKQESTGGLNQIITDRSRFLKPRMDVEMEIRKDLPYVLSTYVRSVSKELAYRDGVEYYYTQFQKDIPVALRRNSMDRAVKMMRNTLEPERGSGTIAKTANFIRSQMYRNFLGMNFKASLQNLTQPEFARWRWSPEADGLQKKLWRRRAEITGPLAGAVDVASSDTPRFLELLKDTGEERQSLISDKFDQIDTFQRSERRNWGQVELGSILNSAMKDKVYPEALKRSNGSEIKAVNEVLKNQDAFDRAVREAAVTSAETQVAAAPSMRAEVYDSHWSRILLMFSAFKARQLQTLGETLGKQEGVSGARSRAILRRGLSNDVAPVEVLREVETNRVALEKMLKEAAKRKENVGIPYAKVQEYIEYLKSQETDLNGIIKQLEPMGGSTPRRAAMVGRYIAKIASISTAMSLLWDTADNLIFDDDDKEKNIVAKLIWGALSDISPIPWRGTNPVSFVQSPVIPNMANASIYGNFSTRGLARDVLSYGMNAVPFAGLIDRATGKKISKAAIDFAAPKKKSGVTLVR